MSAVLYVGCFSWPVASYSSREDVPVYLADAGICDENVHRAKFFDRQGKGSENVGPHGDIALGENGGQDRGAWGLQVGDDHAGSVLGEEFGGCETDS